MLTIYSIFIRNQIKNDANYIAKGSAVSVKKLVKLLIIRVGRKVLHRRLHVFIDVGIQHARPKRQSRRGRQNYFSFLQTVALVDLLVHSQLLSDCSEQ